MLSSQKLGAKRSAIDDDSQGSKQWKRHRNWETEFEDSAVDLIDFDEDFNEPIKPDSEPRMESRSRIILANSSVEKELAEWTSSLQLSDGDRTRDVLSLRVFAHELTEKLEKLDRNFDSLLSSTSPPNSEDLSPRVMMALCKPVTEEVRSHATGLRKIVEEAAANKRTKDKLSRTEIPIDAQDWKTRSEMEKKDQESIQRLKSAADKLEECARALYRLQDGDSDNVAKNRRLRWVQKKLGEARRYMTASELGRRGRVSGRLRKRPEDTPTSPECC
ncbi:hypothetical protein CGMCC3_g16786 [Colletotrichum fructicola]|nr:uncharacterized protein CGMCC3_g16786 [Colletotrichum fructicola]KAE9567063.1 hypothetical protein CGMCC3_g16786 [Colletotrichum fructicola]